MRDNRDQAFEVSELVLLGMLVLWSYKRDNRDQAFEEALSSPSILTCMNL